VVVAVISDTHRPRGTRKIPDRCIERMRSADLILHLGDFTSADVVHELEGLGPPFAGVRGNMDNDDVRRLLPEVRTVNAGPARLTMVHDAGPAAGRLERMRMRFPDADAVLFGHSHIPLHEERDGFHIFNPGSPTDRRSQQHHTMGVMRIASGRVHFELLRLD
jgi:hypothetical protein